MNAQRIAAALRELADAIEDAPSKPRRKRVERLPPPPSQEPTEADLESVDRVLAAKGWKP